MEGTTCGARVVCQVTTWVRHRSHDNALPATKSGLCRSTLARRSTAAMREAPAISSDGMTLYFDSTREGGLGGSDLWCARRIRRGE